MEIREAWAKFEKLRLPLIETQSLLRVGRKLITKYPHLAVTHYAHIVRSLNILKVDAIVGSLRGMSLN